MRGYSFIEVLVVIALIGMLLQVCPPDTLAHRLNSRRQHHSVGQSGSERSVRFDPALVLNFMDSRPVAQLVRALP